VHRNRAGGFIHQLAGLAGCLLLCSCGREQLTKKVLLIGLDGVRVDILAQADTPNIDALVADGSFSDQAQTRPPTVSGPGWSSMLIGVWSDKHLVTGNNFEGNAYSVYPDFLTRLEHVDPGFNTFAVVNWPPLGTTASGGPLISDAVDVKLNIDGDALGYTEADALSLAAAVGHLVNEDPDAAFVYLGDIDVVGHDHNSLAPQYKAAIETADGQVGQLLSALQRRPTYYQEDWLIIVATDHGRTDDGGHGGTSLQEQTIFYLVSGQSTQKGALDPAPNIVDVAVTALSHLGVEIDPTWRLDGTTTGLVHRD